MDRLWAPWRMEFIRSIGADEGCFLCRAGRGEQPDADIVVRRGEHVFCMLNRYPYGNGHLLICPYRHVGDLDDLGEAELLETMLMLRDSKRALLRAVNAQGFNVGVNLGRAAGAGLADHFHLHIVPRWIGDTNFMPVIGETKILPQALEELAGLLRGAWEAAPGEKA